MDAILDAIVDPFGGCTIDNAIFEPMSSLGCRQTSHSRNQRHIGHCNEPDCTTVKQQRRPQAGRNAICCASLKRVRQFGRTTLHRQQPTHVSYYIGKRRGGGVSQAGLAITHKAMVLSRGVREALAALTQARLRKCAGASNNLIDLPSL